MIDLHSHLLPAVDDGSESIEQSVAVLERFERDGVETLICTPHLEASRAAEAPYDDYMERLAALRAAAPARPELRLGFEIMLDVPNADLTDRRLGLGGSPAVLVEFSRTGVPPESGAELSRLRMSGIIPVLAHPERYWGCTLEQVRGWRQNGAAIQTDATILIGRGPMALLARSFLEEGLVDVLASDNHGDRRSLGAVRQWLVESGAEEQADVLTRVNPGRLLEGKEPLPVSPLPREAGLVDRLKELLFGRRG